MIEWAHDAAVVGGGKAAMDAALAAAEVGARTPGSRVTTGTTFTFGRLRSSPESRVVDCEPYSIPGLYAAGELAGGLFYATYRGGAEPMAGSALGRIAGRSAAAFSRA
jgi:succinate dehydrogenase/fumarate reductase flavoprotein subunit